MPLFIGVHIIRQRKGVIQGLGVVVDEDNVSVYHKYGRYSSSSEANESFETAFLSEIPASGFRVTATGEVPSEVIEKAFYELHPEMKPRGVR